MTIMIVKIRKLLAELARIERYARSKITTTSMEAHALTMIAAMAANALEEAKEDGNAGTAG
jgi:hypothetical protein